jgi:NAD(P)-dependent dehydrogenase (short-subunit alcohol dehydrogenase family)
VQAAVDKTPWSAFGGIDICINNASAISPTPTLQTEMKRYDLMNDINTRGTFLVSKVCIPHLQEQAATRTFSTWRRRWTWTPSGSRRTWPTPSPRWA